MGNFGRYVLLAALLAVGACGTIGGTERVEREAVAQAQMPASIDAAILYGEQLNAFYAHRGSSLASNRRRMALGVLAANTFVLAASGVEAHPDTIFAGALVGSGLCYWLGAAGGKPLLLKYGKYFLIRQKDIEKTENWFASHGKATVLVARFVPVVRHIISLPAGIARMRLLPFLVQTFIGATLWGGFLILLGYYMGEHWDTVANKLKRFDLVIGGAIVVAVLVIGVRFFVKRRRERALAENKAD